MGFGDGPDVVAGVSLSMSRNEFVSIVGPSGCGKSTILNAVAGLMLVRGWTVTYQGEQIRGVNTGVAYMTQSDTLLPWRSVEDIVATPLPLCGVTRAQARAKVAALPTMLDLAGAGRKF